MQSRPMTGTGIKHSIATDLGPVANNGADLVSPVGMVVVGGQRQKFRDGRVLHSIKSRPPPNALEI